MPGLTRITAPLLDVLEVLLQAFNSKQQVHGWSLMKAVHRPGPTVYGVLDRLEEAGWVVGQWEEQEPGANTPRRRYYSLTPNGAVDARELLASRRPNGARVPARPTMPGLVSARMVRWLPGGAR